jgi:hypothetical protein
MTKLVKELRAEHVKIFDLFDKVAKSGIASKEAQGMLQAAKNLLLEHLKKEETQVLMFLRNESKTDAPLKTLLERLEGEMQKFSAKATAFFAKYEKGANKGTEFAKEFEGVVNGFSTRIRQKEELLYPAYEKHQNKKAA